MTKNSSTSRFTDRNLIHTLCNRVMFPPIIPSRFLHFLCAQLIIFRTFLHQISDRPFFHSEKAVKLVVSQIRIRRDSVNSAATFQSVHPRHSDKIFGENVVPFHDLVVWLSIQTDCGFAWPETLVEYSEVVGDVEIVAFDFLAVDEQQFIRVLAFHHGIVHLDLDEIKFSSDFTIFIIGKSDFGGEVQSVFVHQIDN